MLNASHTKEFQLEIFFINQRYYLHTDDVRQVDRRFRLISRMIQRLRSQSQFKYAAIKRFDPRYKTVKHLVEVLNGADRDPLYDDIPF